MYKTIGIFTLSAALIMQLSACGEKSSEGVAIAKVDGEPVYASDLKVIKDRMLGNVSEQYIDKTVESKLLDSLVRSRAMSQLMQKQIDAESAQNIESQVKAFRDDLYVRAYVEKFGRKSNVNNDDVKKYYTENLSSFGGASKKSVEVISVKQVKGEALPEATLKALTDLKANKNWKNAVNKINAAEITATYQKQLINESFIKSPLKEVVKKMDEKSEPQLITGKETYLVRVESVQHVPAKPFSEVSDEIRKILQRQSYRKVVETLSEQVMQQVKVEIK